MRRRLTLLLPVVISLAGLLVVANPTLALAGGSVGVQPVDKGGKRTWFQLQASSGATVKDAALVTNDTTRNVHLLISSVDGLTAKTTGAVYSDTGKPNAETGRWIEPDRTTLDLPPGGKQLVNLTIHVPTSATAGDHLGGLAVEDTQVTRTNAGALAVKTLQRTVTALNVRVAGPAIQQLTLTNGKVVPLEAFQTAAVSLDVSGSGQLMVQPKASVTLTGGGYTKNVTRQLLTVLPGDIISYQMPWPEKLNPGPYHIHAEYSAPNMTTAVYDGDYTLAKPLNPTTPTSQPPFVNEVVQKTGAGIPIWLYLAGGVLLVAIIVLLFILLRRRRRDQQPPQIMVVTPRAPVMPPGQHPAVMGTPVAGVRQAPVAQSPLASPAEPPCGQPVAAAPPTGDAGPGQPVCALQPVPLAPQAVPPQAVPPQPTPAQPQAAESKHRHRK